MSTTINDIDFKALAKECKSQEDLEGLTKQFMKNMIEGMLQAEFEEHLEENGGSKNGIYPKTVRSDNDKVALDIQRDREGAYKPQFISKGQRDISGIDDKVIAMYARGMILRDIE